MGAKATRPIERDSYGAEYSILSHEHQATRVYTRIPAWVNCPATEFIDKWLPRFERGELPACSDEEWLQIYNQIYLTEKE